MVIAMKIEDKYYQMYREISQIARELEPYYDIDKVKSYSVYVWSKPKNYASDNVDDWGENVFDIMENEIVFYVKDHQIIEEAIPIIKKIQAKLKEMRLVLEA